MSTRLDTVPALDGQTDKQTDGQTDLLEHYRALYALQADTRY